MIVEDALKEIHRDNISNYFVLPLLRMNVATFMRENFIDSFLTRDLRSILVHIKEHTQMFHRYTAHPDYMGLWRWRGKEGYYIEYRIPFKWEKEVELIAKGRYSELDEKTKQRIYNYSGLTYMFRQTGSNDLDTDVRLLALTKDPGLKATWEEHYDVDLPASLELLEPPLDKAYIDKDELVKVIPDNKFL